MERPRDPLELVFGLRADVATLRVGVAHLATDMGEVEQDLRRLDDRIFQILLIQLLTLATALGSLVTAPMTATR